MQIQSLTKCSPSPLQVATEWEKWKEFYLNGFFPTFHNTEMNKHFYLDFISKLILLATLLDSQNTAYYSRTKYAFPSNTIKTNAHRILKIVSICSWFRVRRWVESIFLLLQEKKFLFENELDNMLLLSELLWFQSPGAASSPYLVLYIFKTFILQFVFVLPFPGTSNFFHGVAMMWCGQADCSTSLPGNAV